MPIKGFRALADGNRQKRSYGSTRCITSFSLQRYCTYLKTVEERDCLGKSCWIG